MYRVIKTTTNWHVFSRNRLDEFNNFDKKLVQKLYTVYAGTSYAALRKAKESYNQGVN